MKYSVLEKTLIKNIEDNIKDVTPGVLVRAYQNGRLVCDVGVGTTYAYYDIASLTKIIFTVQTAMHAFEEGRWTVDSKVSDFVSWFPHKETKIIELLNHSSGLEWWRPFYKDLNLADSWQKRREDLKKMIAELPLTPSDVSVYSDVGFLVLGFVLEEFYQVDLVTMWNKIKDIYYPGTTLEFHPRNQTTIRASPLCPRDANVV